MPYEFTNTLYGIAATLSVIGFGYYLYRVTQVAITTYDDLVAYGNKLMQDESIDMAERKSMKRQIAFIAIPFSKYFLLLFSPLLGFFVTPSKVICRKEKKDNTKEQRPEWEQKFDQLYFKALFTNGPITMTLAAIIGFLSVIGAVLFISLWYAFSSNAHINNAVVPPPKAKAPTYISRVVSVVSNSVASFNLRYRH